MDEESQTTSNADSPADAQDGPPMKEDLAYLSNLKAFLTVLVVLHHTAIAYGGAGQLVYNSPSHPPDSEPLLVAFNAINQTFFMALFFFVAGFLSRRSLERKASQGPGAFAKGRLWRLGLPTLLYSLAGPAVCEIMAHVGRGEGLSWDMAWAEIKSIRGVRGPVWFCASLLIFDVTLAMVWTLSDDTFLPSSRIRLTDNTGATMSGPRLLSALTLLMTLDFFWRIPFPVGTMFEPLNLNLAYLLQYIAAYIYGLSIQNPADAVPGGRTKAILAGVTTVSGLMLASTMSSSPTAPGGLNVHAAVYAVWNNSTGYLVGSSLLSLFQRHANTATPGLTELAYTVFLLHIPVSTLVEVLSEIWLAGPVVKTAVVGLINVVASWCVAWMAWVIISTLKIAWSRTTTEATKQSAGRRRTLSKGQQAIEILEGLDGVGR